MKPNRLLAHAVLIPSALLMIGPFIWMLLMSLKTRAEAVMAPPVLIPAVLHWDNYAKVFEVMPFMTFYYNSLVVAIFVVAGQLLFSSMAAYAFAWLRFPGRDAVFLVCLSILMVPAQLLLVPQFLIVSKLGLLNSLSALIVPNLFSIYGAFLLRQFFEGLPKELEEAAIVDGLNFFQIYWRVMLPLVRPGLIAFGIIVVLFSWNSFLWPLLVNVSDANMTLPVGLASLTSRAGSNYPLQAAATALTVLPLIVLFIVFQKQFVAALASSGIKG